MQKIYGQCGPFRVKGACLMHVKLIKTIKLSCRQRQVHGLRNNRLQADGTELAAPGIRRKQNP